MQVPPPLLKNPPQTSPQAKKNELKEVAFAQKKARKVLRATKV